MKINPGAHLQIVKDGLTLRHPVLPPAPMSPPQPYPPRNPDPMPSPLPPQQISGVPGFAKAYAPTQFFGSRGPQILAEIPSNSASGFTFLDGRYRNLFKRDKSLAKRESTDEGVTGEEPLEDEEGDEAQSHTKSRIKKREFGDKVFFILLLF